MVMTKFQWQAKICALGLEPERVQHVNLEVKNIMGAWTCAIPGHSQITSLFVFPEGLLYLFIYLFIAKHQ